MLDGATKIAELARVAADWGMTAAACTDHGNMCGAIDFYETMSAHNVKPLLGCEFYVAPEKRDVRNPRDPHSQGFHLVLLAEDITGYQNLCHLNTLAWLEGFYYKPRIDKEILAQNSKGLIALTACIAGEIPARILEGNDKAAVNALHEYLDIFGREHLFLEIQNHGMADEAKANARLGELSREYGIPLVATNDSHYLKKEHAGAHDVLLCIGTQSTVDDPKRLRFPLSSHNRSLIPGKVFSRSWSSS